MHRITARLVAVVAIALIPIGCTSTGMFRPGPTLAPFVLSIDDRSSWGTLQVMIGDAVVGHVACTETLAVTPGDPKVPTLPWTVRLVTASGQTIDQRTEDGFEGPRWVLVFDGHVQEGGTVAVGPAPPCALPSPSIAPLPVSGITSAAAIDTGTSLVAARSGTPVRVTTATIGRLATYTTVKGIDPQTFVWALTFTGSFPDPSVCVASPPASPCPSQASALILLDFRTGAELAFVVPGPNQ
jgi:hypothetical protein